jgi:hypothetical protein
MAARKQNDPDLVIKELERKIKRYEILLNQFAPQYNRLIESGTSMVKYLFVMNAGAILALLTFVGNERIPCLFQQLHFTFKILIGGVIAAIGSGFVEYLRQDWSLNAFQRQFNETSNEGKSVENKIRLLINISRFLALLSLIAFVSAITNALRVLTVACN